MHMFSGHANPTENVISSVQLPPIPYGGRPTYHWHIYILSRWCITVPSHL